MEPSPPKPEELGVVVIQGGLSSLEEGDTEAQEGPGLGEDMVTEAREAMVLVWEQEMAKEWGREPDWAHRVGNHVEVEDMVVMAMAHSQVTGLELEPEAIHDQVLELGIPMDRDLRDQNRDMVQELECPMDRVLNPMGMLQELEEFPLDRVLNHPNRDMVQELECPMDRVLSPMDMVQELELPTVLKAMDMVQELEFPVIREPKAMDMVQELAFPMVRVLNPMDMAQELEHPTVVKEMDMVQELEHLTALKAMATVLEQAATLGQETTAMEQVPVWDREDTPRVEQVDTPRVEQVDTHKVEQVDTHRVEQVDTHRVEKVDTHRVEQVDTPRVEQEDTPRVEQVDTPRVEQEDTPRVEQVDTPRVEQVDTPRVEQVDTPRVQENQAKLAVVLIWDREDIPRVEQEDTPRVEQANQRVMVIKWEEHTPGLERATAMGMVEAQLGGPMQCLQAMAMATVLVLEAMVMDPGEESVSFLTMEPQSILLDWMQVMEASLMVLSNWALVVMEANPLANMATVDCHRVHNRVHSLMDLRLVVGNHLAKMETEGALEHSQQAMVKDSWVQVRVPRTVTEQEGRKANMVVVD
ncbi:titin isoform X45 [Oncorhynchus tshawytscha]|uniref:titin isoform X45 n=1 Tax=Oncorhynchus tshawytscha TaxID=74940 RepID=UPI001C3C8E61|nr:titin isoform X45 [Oncorhynchus tshawytscha]